MFVQGSSASLTSTTMLSAVRNLAGTGIYVAQVVTVRDEDMPLSVIGEEVMQPFQVPYRKI